MPTEALIASIHQGGTIFLFLGYVIDAITDLLFP